MYDKDMSTNAFAQTKKNDIQALVFAAEKTEVKVMNAQGMLGCVQMIAEEHFQDAEIQKLIAEVRQHLDAAYTAAYMLVLNVHCKTEGRFVK